MFLEVPAAYLESASRVSGGSPECVWKVLASYFDGCVFRSSLQRVSGIFSAWFQKSVTRIFMDSATKIWGQSPERDTSDFRYGCDWSASDSFLIGASNLWERNSVLAEGIKVDSKRKINQKRESVAPFFSVDGITVKRTEGLFLLDSLEEGMVPRNRFRFLGGGVSSCLFRKNIIIVLN